MKPIARASRAVVPTVRAMVSSAVALDSAGKMVACAAFTLLMLVCAVRALVGGEWMSASVASVLALGIALMTRRWFRRLRTAIEQARAALE